MVHDRQDRTVCVLARRPCFHLDASIELFEGVLKEHGLAMVTTTSPAKAIAHRGPVLVMLVEQYKLAAHVVVFARAVLGRRTAAMVFRAREPLTGGGLGTALKRWLLLVERRLPPVTMMTILPFDLLPNDPSTLFRSWMHDPQLWDIPRLSPPPPDRALAERARARANGRPTVVVMGRMEQYKGIKMMVAMATDPAFCSKFFLVIAGAQEPAIQPMLAAIDGDFMIENRYISDGELYALYDVADYVWAVYAPDYDQASGIFGRAAQFGRTSIVRAGSLVDRYAIYLGVTPVRVEWDASPAEVAEQLAQSPGRTAPLMLDSEASTTALLDALIGEHRG